MTAIPLEKVEAFLKSTPPFSALPEEALARLARRMLMEYFPKGEIFIRAGETPLRFLYLVSKGALKLFTRAGRDETMLDLRSEGDGVGLTAMAAGRPADFNVKAEEDTICYLVPREDVLELAEAYPRFKAFAFDLLKALQPAPDHPDHGSRPPIASSGEEALFLTPVGTLLQRPAVSCPPHLDIRQAATLMHQEKVGSLVVVDSDHRPLGLITDRDLRALVARGDSTDSPVVAVMQTPVASVQTQARCFEALMLMTKKNIHHLPVLDKWALQGVVTQHDLLLLQGNNPVSVVKDIENAPSASRLVQVQHNVDRLLEVLTRQGLSSAGIQDVITMVGDRLVRRLIEITMAQLASEGLGTPPAPWAWVALGRAGRKEQVPQTEPESAILYEDRAGSREQDIQTYFLALASRVIRGLADCGFPANLTHNLADNPRWCQPVSVWQHYFREWFRETEPERLKSAAPFFDGRFLFGREDLVHSVMRVVRHELPEHREFLGRLAENALAGELQRGFFRGHVLSESGRLEEDCDLERGFLQPLVDAVRVLSLSRRLPPTNTLDRLQVLGESGAMEHGLARQASDAFNFLFMLRVGNHLAGRSEAGRTGDRLNPAALGSVDRRALREAFRVIQRLRRTLAQEFQIQWESS
jgi:CBS domain-containing protein